MISFKAVWKCLAAAVSVVCRGNVEVLEAPIQREVNMSSAGSDEQLADRRDTFASVGAELGRESASAK